jgi:hypothetical protein
MLFYFKSSTVKDDKEKKKEGKVSEVAAERSAGKEKRRYMT